MASIFAHSAAALTLGRIFSGGPAPARLRLLAVICACLPDADVIGFAFGVPYESLWGHRGMSHSFVFALFLGALVATLGFREKRVGTPEWWKLSGFFALVTASHSLLDALTDGGLGVAFFSPFDPTRYFFPFRPIAVSPIGVREFFSEWGLRILINEALWIGVPCLLLLAMAALYRRRRDQRRQVVSQR